MAPMVLMAGLPCWAGLGAAQDSIAVDQARMHARHAVSMQPQYAVHVLQGADGARMQEYVAADGRVFAVAWHTQYKPDLSQLLGSAYPSYAQSARATAQRAGLQRQFRHESLDLVVQATAHLNVYSGYAFRQSMVPTGFSLSNIGLD